MVVVIENIYIDRACHSIACVARMCCSVLIACVARMCCSVLIACVARMCCSELIICTKFLHNVRQLQFVAASVAVCCSVGCSVLQNVAVCYSVSRCVTCASKLHIVRERA